MSTFKVLAHVNMKKILNLNPIETVLQQKLVILLKLENLCYFITLSNVFIKPLLYIIFEYNQLINSLFSPIHLITTYLVKQIHTNECS